MVKSQLKLKIGARTQLPLLFIAYDLLLVMHILAAQINTDSVLLQHRFCPNKAEFSAVCKYF